MDDKTKEKVLDEAELTKKKSEFWGTCEMAVNNLTCQFNMPPAVPTQLDERGNEIVNCLPPHKRRMAYAVDKYPACPTNWMHGSDMASSYFVPIQEGQGMWLDFNRCRYNTHDIAIVISVQGVNAITGKKTDQLNLEQYKKNCPVHDVAFQQNRFCPECKFEWPAQNYIASTGTPLGMLWLDGFRTPDGKVRQYIFTAEEARGVAKAIIGKDRVFAIGIGFYLSKKPKPVQEAPPLRTRGGIKLFGQDAAAYSYSAGGYKSVQNSTEDGDGNMDIFHTTQMDADGNEISLEIVQESCQPKKKDDENWLDIASFKRISIPLKRQQPKTVTPKKTYEVGAGASIDQDVYPDPQDIDYWEETPAGMIYINYCDEDAALAIIEAGVREESQEGFMQNIPVGHSK